MDRISPNFIYAFILTRSTLRLLAVIFGKFVIELWPLIDVRITLPFNILRNSGHLLHAKHCSGAIVRFSDNSSCLSKLNEDDRCDRDVWRSSVRSAMRAASQLPGKESTDVDDAPASAFYSKC